MKGIPHGHSVFPFYLRPGPDKRLLQAVGKELQHARGSRTRSAVAQAASVPLATITSIEKGAFHLNLGQLRDVVHRGYKIPFEDLLRTCYNANRQKFDAARQRPFERDYHYSLCLRSGDGRSPTPMLIGGDPQKYLWAVPMRMLKKQPLVTEFLELAPLRKRKPSGATPDNAHEGVEVIHVMHGTVEAHISYSGEAQNTRKLKAGDSLHFHASYTHIIENADKSTSALLLIVRLPKV